MIKPLAAAERTTGMTNGKANRTASEANQIRVGIGEKQQRQQPTKTAQEIKTRAFKTTPETRTFKRNLNIPKTSSAIIATKPKNSRHINKRGKTIQQSSLTNGKTTIHDNHTDRDPQCQ